MSSDPTPFLASLKSLWHDGLLCDAVLVTDDGISLPVHRVVLAAGSGYCRSLFTGAGCDMAEGRQPTGPGTPMVVRLPGVASQALQQIVTAIYSQHVEMEAHTLEELLNLASFLDVPSVYEACVAYMRSVTSLSTAVPLFTLASRFACGGLRAELLTYLTGKFSTLSQPLLQEEELGSMEDPTNNSPVRCTAARAGQARQVAPLPVSQSSETFNRLSHHYHVAPSSAQQQQPPVRSPWLQETQGSRYPQGSSWPHTDSEGALAAMHARIQQRHSHSGGSSNGTAAHPGGLLPPSTAQGRDSVWGAPLSPSHANYRQRASLTARAVSGAHHSGRARQDSSYGLAPPSLYLPLCALSKDLLLELILSDDLAVDCEADVLQVVVDWVAHDPPARMSDLPDLMAAVRTEQLPLALPLTVTLGAGAAHAAFTTAAVQAQLQSQREAAAAAVGSAAGRGGGNSATVTPPCGAQRTPSSCASPGTLVSSQSQSQQQVRQNQDVVQLPHPQQPQQQKPQEGVQPSQPSAFAMRAFGRPRRHQATGIIALGGHDAAWRSLKVVETYDPASDVWNTGPALSNSLSFAGAALVDRDVYVVGATPLWSCVARLPEGCSEWQACPNLNLARAHAGVVACSGSLCVLGGRSQVQTVQHVLPSMELFMPFQGQWVKGPDMCTPRSALAAAALHGACYAVGGQDRKTTASAERFDPGTESWHMLSQSMRQDRKYTSAAVLGGRLYVVGGLDEARTRLASMEAYDPREGHWQQLAPLKAPRSSAGLAALQVGAHGRLYAVGGTAAGDLVHSSVETYVVEKDAWTLAMAPLGYGRAGLGVCAV